MALTNFSPGASTYTLCLWTLVLHFSLGWLGPSVQPYSSQMEASMSWEWTVLVGTQTVDEMSLLGLFEFKMNKLQKLISSMPCESKVDVTEIAVAEII